MYVPGGFTGSYMAVDGVGSSGDYAQLERYLTKYCSINHGSLYTYLRMFREASHKIVDLSEFLDLSDSMIDGRILFRRCDVRYDPSWYNTPGDKQHSGNRYLILMPDPADKAGTSTVGRVWVHIVQHLLISALIGDRELHGDNPLEFGKGVFALMVKKLAPQQAIPSCSLLCETFQYRFGEVAEDLVPVTTSRDYFMRNRKCFSAWRKGVLGQMASVIGAHPLEDVIHIHAWVQMHITHCGKLPSKFYYMPGMVPRGAELVPGRIYPVIGDDDELGVVCVCPEGLAFTLLQLSDGSAEALPLDRWQQFLQNRGFCVGPLVFRKHAVVQLEESCVGIIQEQPVLPGRAACIEDWHPIYDTAIHDVQKRNFLDCRGNYMVFSEAGSEPVAMPWQEAHERLIPLGAHMVVLKERLPGHHFPPGTEPYVRGWLRYPEDFDEGGGSNEHVYIAFRIAQRANDFDDVVILPIRVDYCRRLIDSDSAIDYMLP
jgi:hypothetical protein